METKKPWAERSEAWLFLCEVSLRGSRAKRVILKVISEKKSLEFLTELFSDYPDIMIR
jgi:hypothetical protein